VVAKFGLAPYFAGMRTHTAECTAPDARSAAGFGALRMAFGHKHVPGTRARSLTNTELSSVYLSFFVFRRSGSSIDNNRASRAQPQYLLTATHVAPAMLCSDKRKTRRFGNGADYTPRRLITKNAYPSYFLLCIFTCAPVIIFFENP